MQKLSLIIILIFVGKSPHDFRKGALLQPGGYCYLRSGEYAFSYSRGDNPGERQSLPV